MRLRIIFVFTILFYHIGIWAGDMSFRHISSGEGLKYTWVWNIFKDSRGYMWFSTTYGAYRYNGYSFEEYTFKYLENDFRSKHRRPFPKNSGNVKAWSFPIRSAR